MKGSKPIIDALNDVLTAELTAVNQYFIHAKMQQNWGYKRLYAHTYHESIDEMRHADKLIERILFLGGVPNLQRLNKVNVGETVDEQFKLDLEMEYDAVKRFQTAIELCRAEHDEVSAVMLTRMAESEHEHVDWLEAQHDLIAQVGLQNYLAQQIHGGESHAS